MKAPTGMKQQDFNDAFKTLKKELLKKEFSLKRDTKAKLWIDPSQISYDDKIVRIPFIYKKIKASYEFYRNARVKLKISTAGELYWSPILGDTKRFKVITSALTDKNQKIRDLANYARENKGTLEFKIPGTTIYFTSKPDIKKRLVSEFFEVSFKDSYLPDFIFRHKTYRWLKIRKDIPFKRTTIKEIQKIVREIENQYHHNLNPNLPLGLVNFEYEKNQIFGRSDWIIAKRPTFERVTISITNSDSTLYNYPEHLISLDRFLDRIKDKVCDTRLIIGLVFVEAPLPKWSLILADAFRWRFKAEEKINSLDEITPQKIEKIIQERFPDVNK